VIWREQTQGVGITQALEVTEVHSVTSAFQSIEVFDHATFGRVLALDGTVQLSQADEFIYHELAVHVPLCARPAARRVLIVGGGDGGILREALRHRALERVTLVEIDRAVVDLCLEWMPSIPGKAFRDRRTELVIADGARYVAETDERFDVVIVDSTDPLGPGEVLFGDAFYRGCKRVLNPGGVLVNQNGVPFMQPGEARMTWRRRRRQFRDVGFYVAAVPSYYGGLMALGWASDDRRKREIPPATLARRFAAAKLRTKYYTPELHRAAFALPAFIRDRVR
jgi:spermidine synthase